MSQYYGVKCKTCEENIVLGEREGSDGSTITFYTAPLNPVPCNACGSSYMYVSDDLIEF